ncbi:hypothetical protein ONS95_013658 [Cadophora gregata]|uniref:uncharacterized protein n=1 Tax=Cadophora gregata TaxID=51156 RepID=UPI0026DD4E4F|nr:uncharacterized protein ONS95_013658 [Cadophora gregata]KAK0114156.1 hypothetical protein ONS95_013658 [Cadophora gregata]
MWMAMEGIHFLSNDIVMLDEGIGGSRRHPSLARRSREETGEQLTNGRVHDQQCLHFRLFTAEQTTSPNASSKTSPKNQIQETKTQPGHTVLNLHPMRDPDGRERDRQRCILVMHRMTVLSRSTDAI